MLDAKLTLKKKNKEVEGVGCGPLTREYLGKGFTFPSTFCNFVGLPRAR